MPDLLKPVGRMTNLVIQDLEIQITGCIDIFEGMKRVEKLNSKLLKGQGRII